jgi:hypothetical protein
MMTMSDQDGNVSQPHPRHVGTETEGTGLVSSLHRWKGHILSSINQAG